MATKYELTKKKIQNGVYEGVLKADGPIGHPELVLSYLGQAVGEILADQVEGRQNQWLIRAKIPAEVITDGAMTFLIHLQGQTDVLDKFVIVAGEDTSSDIYAEMDLLRAELDLLKRAFRRHCVETLGG